MLDETTLLKRYRKEINVLKKQLEQVRFCTTFYILWRNVLLGDTKFAGVAVTFANKNKNALFWAYSLPIQNA